LTPAIRQVLERTVPEVNAPWKSDIVIWATVTIDVPVLASQVAAILESLPGAEA
jgi:hypothetical protein